MLLYNNSHYKREQILYNKIRKQSSLEMWKVVYKNMIWEKGQIIINKVSVCSGCILKHIHPKSENFSIVF